MKQFGWIFALPLAWALSATVGTVSAASIRDEAGMFSAGALKAATTRLDEFEKATKVPVIIETVSDLGLPSGASKSEKYDAIEKVAISRDRKAGNRGIFLVISKGDHVISNTLIPQHLATSLPADARRQIRDAFGQGVSSSMRAEGRKSVDQADQDAGLKSLVSAIEKSSDRIGRGQAIERHDNSRAANNVPVPQGAGRGGRGGGSPMSTFLMIGLGIVAVLFLVRVIGGIFGGGQSAGMGMPRPGMGPGQGFGGPGYGPGYGGGGYGGRGGGFFSGMLGGLGGALAGNWLYDQMSGRHGSHTDASSYPTGDTGGYYNQGDEPIVGGNDGGNGGASWGDSGGGDWGGGDGGADWGGGGGDWGGGGGDGGGDW